MAKKWRRLAKPVAPSAIVEIKPLENEQDPDVAQLRALLARLEIEHEDYDHAIEALIAQGDDQLRIQRFKKKKLAVKDEIAKLRDRLLPDIIA